MRAKVSFIVETSYLENAQHIKEAIQELFELDTDLNLPGSPDFDKITYLKVKELKKK